MTVELLQTLSLVSFIVAGILFLAGVVLFFVLDVPKLYGDVSGRTAKKAIEAIRQQSESSGNKTGRTSTVNTKRGKLTDKITKSGHLEAHATGIPVSIGTEKLSTSALSAQANETTVLGASAEETTILTPEAAQAGETTVLEQAAAVAGETTVVVQEIPAESGEFTINVEMSFTESPEIIE